MDRDERRARRTRDRGTAGVETAIAVVGLLSVAMFVIGGIRITNSGGDVQFAANAGARAAAAARAGNAQTLGQQVVTQTLSDRGQACVGGPSVSVSRSSSAVTVTVRCQVGLGDVGLAGFSDSRTVTASATEYVDPLRGGDG